MEDRFDIEAAKLAGCWQKYDREYLRSYLVESVQDPRINIQSILTRHYLINQLFPDQFDFFMEHEIRFSLVINWLIGLWKDGFKQHQQAGILWALFENQNQIEGIDIPGYVLDTFNMLEPQNYICSFLTPSQQEESIIRLEEYNLDVFQNVWNDLLSQCDVNKISVIEPACGSANDWRFIDSFGISRFIDFHGFDICEKNILNCREMFMDSMFSVGNSMQIDQEDNSFDYCYVHDLFEHLSEEAMEKSISEICRVASKGICAHFFNMAEIDENRIVPSGDYHWNELSREMILTVFEKYASSVEALSIDKLLTERFGCSDTNNKGAYTLYIKA